MKQLIVFRMAENSKSPIRLKQSEIQMYLHFTIHRKRHIKAEHPLNGWAGIKLIWRFHLNNDKQLMDHQNISTFICWQST